MIRLLLVLLLCVHTAWAQLVTVPIPGSPLSLSVMANPQPLQELKNNPNATLHQLGDDGWANVPLPFLFPFYGQSFNQSTMYSNGAVQFGNPVPAGGWPNWNNAFCCQGIQLNSGVPQGYNYSILVLQTDLAGWEGINHYTLGTANSMTYGWYGVSQFGYNDNRSTFELKIDSGGGIDMRWAGARVTYSPVTIGTIGNAALGEYTQNYYNANGIEITSLTQLSTGPGIDPCVTNVLSSPTCPGYAAAYLTQQCTVSALYDPTCPGYQQVYFSNQCALNPLYNSQCPGYAQAYFDQQCLLDGLYDRKCPGYAQAWATQQLLSQQNNSTPDSQTTQTTESPTVTPVIQAASTAAATNSGPEITSAAPSANPANVTTAVPLVQSAPVAASAPAAPTAPAAIAASQTERTPAPAPSQSPAPAQPQTRAQQIQQARQEAARRSQASQGTAAQAQAREAQSLEQQAQVQGSIIAAMGYNAAFSAYENTLLRDVQFYRPRDIYTTQTTVDNRRALGGLTGPSDSRWETMRDQQYR